MRNIVLILKQGLLIDNFMHGDLHHKNWKIRPYNKQDYQIILYDTGLFIKSDITINRILKAYTQYKYDKFYIPKY